ncbi:MAG: PD-(D/E)XK nuclease family protein [Nanoarchaeota archaeon]
MTVDFNDLIDNYLKKESYPRTIGRYWPSEAGGCLRKNWYSFRIPKPVDKPLSRIFEAGNMIHEFVADVIQSDKNSHVELLDKELPIKIQRDGYVVSGRIDDLILVLLEGREYLVEVKSTKYLPVQPRVEHLMQLQLYMSSLGVHDGIMLYIKKDDLQTKQFSVDYDESQVLEVLERFDKLHKHLVSDKIPEAEAKTVYDKNWMCAFCPYLKECDEEVIRSKVVRDLENSKNQELVGS